MTTSLELQHFAILDIKQFHHSLGILIITTTNNPCHLTCYYTDKEPVRHATSRVVRGLALPWGAYWCFVAWQSLEQQEAGDTLTHTFDLTPWPICQTRWFTFRGTVEGTLSPSASALFKKHYDGATPEQKFEFYDDPEQTYSNIYEPNRSGQTFTPRECHLLTKVYTFIHRVSGTYPNLYLEIKEAPDDTPTGPVLSSGYTVWAVIPEWPDPAWVETPMSRFIIKPNVKYAIIMRTAWVGAGILRWWRRYRDATYPGGIRIYSTNSGNTCSKFPLHDFLFQEWGIPPKGEP